MARVFISYRRADGQYAVGWLQERLRRVPSVTGVEIAFRDADLLCGDDYVSALVRRVEECDVLIAVIGPNWHGHHDDGRPSRIMDPDDWVAREITTALGDEETTILPLLIDGAEPLSPDDLLPQHAGLARMHAVRFDDGVGLDEFVGDLEAQLARVDRERARTRGLEHRIEVPSMWPSPRAWALMLLAAVVAGAARLWLTRVESVAAAQYDAVAVIWVASGAAIAVYLTTIAAQRLRPLAHVRLLPVVLAAVVASAVMIWFSVVDDNFFVEGPEGWRFTVIALSVPAMVPAAYIVLGVGWMERRMGDHEIGRRVQLIAEHDRASVITAVLFSLWATLGIWGPEAVEDRLFHITAAGSASLVIAGAVVWARTRLERESVALEAEIAPLGAEHQRHAREHLVTEPLSNAMVWLVVLMVLPTVAGVLRTLVLP